MMLFAILFGLSMDYEVFLLSRIKEEHDRTPRQRPGRRRRPGRHRAGDHGRGRHHGGVFLTFVFQTDATAKLFGLGPGRWPS